MTKAPRTCEWLDGGRGAYVRCEAPACTGKSWCAPHLEVVLKKDFAPWRLQASRGGDGNGGVRDASWLWWTGPNDKPPIGNQGRKPIATGYNNRNVIRMLGAASEIHTIPHGT